MLNPVAFLTQKLVDFAHAFVEQCGSTSTEALALALIEARVVEDDPQQAYTDAFYALRRLVDEGRVLRTPKGSWIVGA